MDFKHILIPVDGSEHAARALSIACDLALSHDSRITLLHVLLQDKAIEELRRVEAFGRLSPDAVERIRQVETVSMAPLTLGAGAAPIIVPDDVLKELGALVLDDARAFAEGRGVRIENAHMEAGEGARLILAHAEQGAVDLIVLGSRGLGSFRGILYGSTSQKVAHSAKCPTVSVT